MPYSRINKSIENFIYLEYVVAKKLNSEASINKWPRVYLPRQVFEFFNVEQHPDVAVVSIPLKEDGLFQRLENGNPLVDKRYSINTQSDEAPNGYFELINSREDLALYTIDGKEHVLKNASKRPTPFSHFAPKEKDFTAKEGETGTRTGQQVHDEIIEAMKALPLNITGKYSNGSKTTSPAYLYTLAEYDVAATMSKKAYDGVYYPTTLRTELPMPFGGIDDTKADKKGNTEADKLQFTGADIQKLPNKLKVDLKRPKKDGKSYDVKLIMSYNGTSSKGAAVECWTQEGSVYKDRDETLWTWDPTHKADIIFVLRDTAYVVSKENLRAEILKTPKNHPSTGKNEEPKKGTNIFKWNLYLSTDKLLDLCYDTFPMSNTYKELLSKNAKDIKNLLDTHWNDPKNSDYKPNYNRFLNHYEPSINPQKWSMS